MTSKESTHGVVNSINNSTFDANGNVNVICEDTVLNDLEVLEILKSKSYLVSNEDGWLCLKIDKINMFKDEFDKIMRWLDNDK